MTENGDYVVGPTSTDVAFALMYANDILRKQQCLAHPDKYEWVPDATTRYPCPAGLTCESGTCRFTETGCRAAGELSYYDCVRRDVPCNIDGQDRTCAICDYRISEGHTIEGLAAVDAPPNCAPGDSKYADPVVAPPLVHGELCFTTDDCPDGAVCAATTTPVGTAPARCVVQCSSASDCPDTAECSEWGVCVTSTADPTLPRACPAQPAITAPYTVTMFDPNCPVDCTDAPPGAACGDTCPTVATPVPCVVDEDCAVFPGVGGACGPPGTAAAGACYNNELNPRPYLNWYPEVELWTGLPPARNVCMEQLDASRRWCEMPWTRPGTAAPDDDTNELTLPVEERVRGAWKTRARPPFWYDPDTGRCHITRTYCKANLEDGGFSAGYGQAKDYFLLSSCAHPHGKSNEVDDRYDCCTTLGDSVAQFFLGGRTVATDLKELVADGDPRGFRQRWREYVGVAGTSPTAVLFDKDPALAKALEFVSDPRMKTNVQRVGTTTVANTAVGVYKWQWNALAAALYNLQGIAHGVLTPEVHAAAPELVQHDTHGTEHVVVHVPPANTAEQDVMLLMQQIGELRLAETN